MPYAVTHVILTIIAIDLYRDYIAKHKRYFSLHTLFLGGLAGLLPDIDYPLSWLFSIFGINLVHGSITHTIWFALPFLILGFIILRRKKHKQATILFVMSFGIIFHVFLDWFLGGGMDSGVMWFYPISTEAFALHLAVKYGSDIVMAGIDAMILLVWLWHEEIKHKISDFI